LPAPNNEFGRGAVLLKRRARRRRRKCPQIGTIHELTKPELFRAVPPPLTASAVFRPELMADK
jgi:hypothetical protein